MGSKIKELPSIRVMVIAETDQQRHALSDVISQLGFELIDCIAPEAVSEEYLTVQADLWMVDSGFDDNYSDYDDELYVKLDRLIENNSLSSTHNTQIESRHGSDLISPTANKPLMLVGFEQAPRSDEINLYAKWQRKLTRKLASMLEMPELIATNTETVKYRPWDYIALLIVGPNEIKAVQSFLDQLPSDLSIALLLIQQIEEEQYTEYHLHSMPRVLSQHNSWRCQVISLALNMQAGNCYIVPTDQDVVCNSTGRVIMAQVPNVDLQSSNIQQLRIQQLLNNCTEAFGEQLISILFTDVDSDLTLDLKRVKQNQSQVWQLVNDETLHVSRSSSDSKYINLSGPPHILAQHLANYVEQKIKN